jgi:hypothetical protein
MFSLSCEIMTENNSSTTCYKSDIPLNRITSVLTNQTIRDRHHELDLEIWRQARNFLYYCMRTGQTLDVEVTVKVKPSVDMVLAQYPCVIDSPKEEINPKIMEMLNAGFGRLDAAKEANKERIKKAILKEYPDFPLPDENGNFADNSVLEEVKMESKLKGTSQ